MSLSETQPSLVVRHDRRVHPTGAGDHPGPPLTTQPSADATNDRPETKRSVLHICERETLRPLRDQVLRHSGLSVESSCSYQEGLERFYACRSDLVLIDVEDEAGVDERGLEAAQHLCSKIKASHPHQLVAFVCNWRIAIQTDCPDAIVRTEFNPATFAAGVHAIVSQVERS